MTNKERELIYALCFSDKDTDLQVVKSDDGTLHIVSRSGKSLDFCEELGELKISKPAYFKQFAALYGALYLIYRSSTLEANDNQFHDKGGVSVKCFEDTCVVKVGGNKFYVLLPSGEIVVVGKDKVSDEDTEELLRLEEFVYSQSPFVVEDLYDEVTRNFYEAKTACLNGLCLFGKYVSMEILLVTIYWDKKTLAELLSDKDKQECRVVIGALAYCVNYSLKRKGKEPVKGLGVCGRELQKKLVSHIESTDFTELEDICEEFVRLLQSSCNAHCVESLKSFLTR